MMQIPFWVEFKKCSKGKTTLVGGLSTPENNSHFVGKGIIKQIIGACKNNTAIIMGQLIIMVIVLINWEGVAPTTK